MQSAFLTVSHFRTILLSLFVISFQSLQAHETVHEQLKIMQAKVTVRFTHKIEKTQQELATQADLVKKDPLYTEFERALEALLKEPSYVFYNHLKEACAFIDRLKEHHQQFLGSDLLVQVNDLIGRLNEHEQLTSFRSTLKKERVALIELGEERDLLVSLEKILTYQGKDLKELLRKEWERIMLLSSYNHAQEVQRKYRQTSVVKKFLTICDQLDDLIIQEEIALLKNRDYQRLLRSYELMKPIHSTFQYSNAHEDIRRDSIRLQHELHTVSLDETL